MNNKVLFLYNQELRQEVICLSDLLRGMEVEKKELFTIIVDRLDKIESVLELELEEKICGVLRQWIQEENWLIVKKNIIQRLIILLELFNSFLCKNAIDEEFCEIYKGILTLGIDKLYEQMVRNFNQYCEQEPINAKKLMKSYNRTLYWGGY